MDIKFTPAQLTAMRDFINTTGPSTSPPKMPAPPIGTPAENTAKDLLNIIDKLEQHQSITLTLANDQVTIPDWHL